MTDHRAAATHPEVLRLAVPMILSNLSVPLLGLVDTAVVGHLPDPEYLGAVAVGAMVFSFIFWGFGFLRMGTTGFVAQAWGRSNLRELRLKLAQAALMAAGLSLLVLLLQWPIAWAAFGLIEATPGVESGAQAYFGWRIWASPATLMNYVLIGAFLGAQNARVPLAITLTTNGVNIVLDLLFVVGWDMGVEGVALASAIGEYFGLAVALWQARRHGLLGGHGLLRQEILNAGELLAMARVNSDIMIRTLCLIFAFAFFTQQGALQGEVILAANAVLINFQHLLSYGLDGFAHAAEALVGRAVGAGSPEGLSSAVRKSGVWSLGAALVYSLAFWLFGDTVISLLTDIKSVQQAAGVYLPWLAISPLVSVWSFWLDGVFIGATRGREMRNAMVFSTLIVFLPVWWLTRSMGNHGLWLALMAFLAARGISMGLLYGRLRQAVVSEVRAS